MRIIDADEFIKSINERIKEAIKWYDECRTDEIKIRAEQAMVTFCEAYFTAKKMPTIDAEPVRHGRWSSDCVCSECGEVPRSGMEENYCPNCGAKMDLDEVKNEIN